MTARSIRPRALRARSHSSARRARSSPGTSRRALPAALLALGLAACASAPAEPARPSATLTPVSELPAAHRELLAAYGAGGETWRARRERLAGEPELARFLADNLVREMLRAFDASKFATASDPDAPFDRAQTELVLLAEHSTPVLTELLAIADGVAAHLAAQTLERIGAPATKGVTKLLEREGREPRRRAAELLGKLPHAHEGERWVQEALARRLAEDPEWIVRAQAAQSLARRGARDTTVDFALARLAAGLRDADAAVARASAEGLAELGDLRALPRLVDHLERSLASDRPGDVQAAQRALVRLTGIRDARTPRDWRAVGQRLRAR